MRKNHIFGKLRGTPFHPQWLLKENKEIGKWVGTHAFGTVLDIGCASRWVEEFLPDGTKYIGLDYPATGKTLYKATPDIYADASLLPLATDSCDCVLLLEVLEHVSAHYSALQEISRVLRPGGMLILTMPFLYPTHDAPHDYQRLTSYGLQRDIQATGMEIISIEPHLNTIETASLLACLALGGSALLSAHQRKPAALLIPLLVFVIAAINIGGRLLGLALPHWPAFTSGYRAIAMKRSTGLSTPEVNGA